MIKFFLILTIWYCDTVGFEGESLQSVIYKTRSTPDIDTIILLPGKYHLAINYDTAMCPWDTSIGYVGLILLDSIVLMGISPELCTLTAISQDSKDTAWHCIFMDSTWIGNPATKIKNLTLTGGKATGAYPHDGGGGILVLYSAIEIGSCVVYKNYGKYFAGIGAENAAYMMVRNCMIKENEVTGYYGILGVCWSCTLFVYDCKVMGNKGVGAIAVDMYSWAQVRRCTIEGNEAPSSASLFVRASHCDFDSNIVQNNKSSPWQTIGYREVKHFPYYGISTGTISNNVIRDIEGAGIRIGESQVKIENNIFENIKNGAIDNVIGGEIESTKVSIKSNIFINNESGREIGSVACCWEGFYGCPKMKLTFTDNFVFNNETNSFGTLAGFGGQFDSIVNNVIVNNQAKGYSVIYFGLQWYPGKCVVKGNLIAGNKSEDGIAILDSLIDKFIIDSCLIVDNGAIKLITRKNDTAIIQNSNIYYNTYQKDFEIMHKGSGEQDTGILILKNNFFNEDSAGLSSLISGRYSLISYSADFIKGVNHEPLKIDSVRNYSCDYQKVVDSISTGDTLYLRLYGESVTNKRDVAICIVSSNRNPKGIAVTLLENDEESGVYEGKVCTKIEDVSDIRMDDIFQIIRVYPDYDEIKVASNMDTSKFFIVKVYGDAKLSRAKVLHACIKPNPFRKRTVICYTVPEDCEVEIKVYNLLGKCVDEIYKGNLKQGEYSFIWQREDLPSGLYFVKIKMKKGDKIIYENLKLIKLK